MYFGHIQPLSGKDVYGGYRQHAAGRRNRGDCDDPAAAPAADTDFLYPHYEQRKRDHAAVLL